MPPSAGTTPPVGGYGSKTPTWGLGSAREDEEIERLVSWRLDRFYFTLGFPLDLAEKLARAHIDWHKAEGLLADGCSHDCAAEILL